MSYSTEPTSEDALFSRSPELLSRGRSGLLIIDVQEKLIPAIVHHEQLQWNLRRLLDGASLLKVPCWGTEQYPEGLGPTVPSLAQRLGDIPAKKRFSAYGCGTWPKPWVEQGIHQVVVAGIEERTALVHRAGSGWTAEGAGSVHVFLDGRSAELSALPTLD